MSGILRLLAKEADVVKAWRDADDAARRAEDALVVEMVGSTNIAIGERRRLWGAAVEMHRFSVWRDQAGNPHLGVIVFCGGFAIMFPVEVWLTMEGPL